jgi:hypothetical protein
MDLSRAGLAHPLYADPTLQTIIASVMATQQQLNQQLHGTTSNREFGPSKKWSAVLAYRMAGYSGHFPEDPEVPAFYRSIVEATTEGERHSIITAKCQEITNRVDPSFAAFKPTESFFRDVANLRFAPDYASDQGWHRSVGGLGPFLPQSASERERLRNISRTRQDYGDTIMDTTGSAQQHNSKPPDAINISLETLISAVHLNAVWHKHTLGDGPWNQFAEALRNRFNKMSDELHRQRYMETLGPTAIYEFNKAAAEFFSDIVTPDFAQHCRDVGRKPGSSLHEWTPSAITNISAPKAALPASLQRKQFGQPQLPPLHPGDQPNTPQKPPGRPTTTQDQTNRRRQPFIKPSGPPPGYAELWAASQPGGRAVGTNQLCQKINETAASLLTLLNLSHQDCLNYHIRGICGNVSCKRTHSPTVSVNAAAAATLLQKLKVAKTQL